MKTHILFKIILLLSSIFIYSACETCPKNYTAEIRAVLIPMQTQLRNFFDTEQMYPNNAQRDRLLESSGCQIVDSVKQLCIYKGTRFAYHSAEGTLYPAPVDTNVPSSTSNRVQEVTPVEPQREDGINVYTFTIIKENSLCTFDMTYLGEVLQIDCIQHSCFSK